MSTHRDDASFTERVAHLLKQHNIHLKNDQDLGDPPPSIKGVTVRERGLGQARDDGATQ